MNTVDIFEWCKYKVEDYINRHNVSEIKILKKIKVRTWRFFSSYVDGVVYSWRDAIYGEKTMTLDYFNSIVLYKVE